MKLNGPMPSTSVNLKGESPAQSWKEARAKCGGLVEVMYMFPKMKTRAA